MKGTYTEQEKRELQAWFWAVSKELYKAVAWYSFVLCAGAFLVWVLCQ